MLIAHEFAHIAHLTRPSRNTWTRRLWEAMPADIGPIALRAPRWVVEGYATFIEGRVTGSGRPHGAWRAAFLRQWAIEGQLPRYEYLDDWGAYAGGSFAYLAGSAFIEWLAEQHGDSSLVFVWRRLSARQNRTLRRSVHRRVRRECAALYGRFTAELTMQSLDIAHTMAAATNDTGAIVQRLARSTGDPAISADGQARRDRRSLGGRAVARRDLEDRARARHAASPARFAAAQEPILKTCRRDRSIRRRRPRCSRCARRGGASYESPRFLRDGRVLLSRSTRARRRHVRRRSLSLESRRGIRFTD